MSLERTRSRWNKGKGKTFGFCAHCMRLMDAEDLLLHMMLNHGEIIPEEDRYDRTNGKSSENYIRHCKTS